MLMSITVVIKIVQIPRPCVIVLCKGYSTARCALLDFNARCGGKPDMNSMVTRDG